MAWQTEMVRILRHLIDDLGINPDYDDSRLEELILIAGQLTLADVVFEQTYTIDVDELTLSPDPTSAPKDDAFINLVCLKARCELYSSTFRQKAKMAGISVKSGSESISSAGIIAGFKMLMDKACQDYKDSKWEFEAGNRVPGRAIIGPFAGDSVGWLDVGPNQRYNNDFH